ncbi:hypothetical protein BV509_20630 [Rhodovulum sulfidophilum]|uniref:VWA domain-containing protein n=1 Tax=Rhodovulum visakhapatnamense TaxID=364297 RepID=A0ABS1RDW0_9RHOB|nr:VWA domain-containing protein [Rhodovulum visakhapatnamense]MBL3569755.1 VWA domain-containing protein [Rhodovulum visakhapatnamense]MBL3577837.1 VWA domain-containing protein [Rhodovulum visakhapatnamense]OLS42333.1 hypothetical protein BV509_20630 [Rhodovulum sulfidophilum]
MIAPRRLLPPLLAAGFAGLAALNPAWPVTRDLRDALIVIDITRSMNVRDMAGRSRLDAARAVLRDWISRQPCGTRAGLAVFTERRTLTLIAPVDVCADFASLDRALAALDWRMAWEGDSMVSKGLNHGLARARAFGVPLIFVTDGHEAPPLPYSGPETFSGDCPGGVIVGAGGDVPAPIPKFDDDGREAGFYGPADVQHAPARRGPPPPDAASRPGFHPRNNPYGEADLDGTEHLSALRASHLRRLAAPCGLGVVRLSQGPAALDAAMAAHARTRTVTVRRGLAPLFGLFALAALVAGWAPRHLPPRNGRSRAFPAPQTGDIQ